MLNITAHGNLGKDPELKNVGQNQVASFTLAARTGKDETTWMNCAVWGKRAQTAAEYSTRAQRSPSQAKASLNSYTTQDGTERQSLERKRHRLYLASTRNQSNGCRSALLIRRH